MSTPSPAASSVADEYIADVQAMTMNSTLGIVVAALLLYDILLTSGQEYLYIWQSPKTWTSRVVYLWNRYMYSVYYILSLGAIQSISDTSKILGGLALVLGMAPFVVNAISAYQRPPINLPAPLNCTEYNTASTSVNIGWVSVRQFLPDKQLLTYPYSDNSVEECSDPRRLSGRRRHLVANTCSGSAQGGYNEATVTRTGDVGKRNYLFLVRYYSSIQGYSRTLVSINIVDMVLDILSITVTPGAASSYVVAFVDPISSALNSRFLLALHETNARMGGTDASMVSSLNFNAVSGGDPRVSSPELPGSLGVLGGPIHSFHEDDDDLESLQLASWSQEEHQVKPGLGGVAESGGDGDGEEVA
ncbi:uncharacterized protein TRAVEDRAFT_49627 [Trametes versicolor FP-101664 SS1]|uniref:uncharacterized protein n=1 Tax=Trametes versicolor (strain FP-101664) TaxID=717944 RepID=UPI0004624816|nr:uncharacterized protein TRAVEDRAFT_49627 [Trametes versicolor FP-101664 SS1]EIW56805.1 hypothetical protein TRAVEDRAFT_49627 [Trametes versicolor FP-101664 SS1]